MPETDDRLPVYPMRVVCRMTGLTERQIRYWEKLGLVAPARTPGEQRLFSVADVQRLKQVKRLKDEGIPLRSIRAKLTRVCGPPAGPVPIKGARTENGWVYEDARTRFGAIPVPPEQIPVRKTRSER
ncbi:MAG TPA: MerR family transcriptional regulator [Firmicutes bacterium]|nr:MerR family transcriptional regulator [Bacillota bacterium]